MRQLTLSVIIPAYNEEALIVDSIDETYNALRAAGIKFEMIVVDDGSNDETLSILKSNKDRWNHMVILSHSLNKGFGGAIRTGIENSTKEYILCVPVDSPIDFVTLNAFLEAAEVSDLIASYRLKRLGYSLRMHINSYVYQKLISLVSGMGLRDYNWIHLYRKSIFDQIEFHSSGIFMMAEILMEADKKHLRINEIPVEQRQRIHGIATASKVSTIVFVLQELFQYLRNRKK